MAWVQSLTGEPRSRKPTDIAKKKKKTELHTLEVKFYGMWIISQTSFFLSE